ncbi:hypothetical protein WCLP8_4140001 [uncultured Gammaproteobacteria bacterium]
MKKPNDLSCGVFLNTMISTCSIMVSDLSDEYNAERFWITEERDKWILMAISLRLPDSGQEVWVRFTAAEKWFQIDCGPVSERVSYSREGADIISSSINDITNWIRDYFDEPESVDESLLNAVMPFENGGALWPISKKNNILDAA